MKGDDDIDDDDDNDGNRDVCSQRNAERERATTMFFPHRRRNGLSTLHQSEYTTNTLQEIVVPCHPSFSVVHPGQEKNQTNI